MDGGCAPAPLLVWEIRGYLRTSHLFCARGDRRGWDGTWPLPPGPCAETEDNGFPLSYVLRATNRQIRARRFAPTHSRSGVHDTRSYPSERHGHRQMTY
jgi:hypothetical protein